MDCLHLDSQGGIDRRARKTHNDNEVKIMGFRKTIITAAALLLCILLPGTALGNSAPVYEPE